jgi:hypothetical protein
VNLMNRIYKDSGTKQKNRINILASVRSRKGDSSVNRSVVRHPTIINICARKTFGRIKDTCSLSRFKAKIPDFHDFTNIVMNHSKNNSSYCTTGIETFIDLDARFSDLLFYHSVPFEFTYIIKPNYFFVVENEIYYRIPKASRKSIKYPV